ncbi:MAG: Eco57I restriction-modification methylase domain-containing protein, partial [Gammaproteobacteria bacterium]|nr:Eco57I restriction-modification methylase domain-containing protein [Gammaproteobacteria bacterium]
MADDLPRRTLEALGALAGETPLREGMARLLNTLGYVSSRTAEAGTVPGFLESFRPQKPLTLKQRRLFDDWREVEIVFQVTGDEIEPSRDELSVRDGPGFDGGRAQSFLFLAVDMQSAAYRRADLANTARTVNRLFRMPVIVLFRYGSALTLATVHRRASKRDDDRDVLEKVTLVKDIRLDDPHRAHIDILNELALKDMIGAGVRNFDDLHAKWEQTLKIEALNKRFYKELFDWFERAVVECRFPDDGAGDGCPQRQVIRLITRLLFIWFLKEKGLIPGGLFEEPFAREQVRNHSPESANYYRAVLQNLFFATLNTEIDKRAFIEGSTLSRDSGKYCYRDLLRDPEGFVDTLSHVPFVNGGLFDCLDELVEGGTVARLIDAFTENIESEGRELHVPARLLLDDENGLFGLFRRYKFTIEESTPLDTEVALDPELLGRVFENLLAAYNPETRDTARKETGSFYTPRPVVDYMVREALAEALAAKTRPTTTPHEHWRDQLGYLLDWEDENADAGEFFDADEARVVIRAIAELRTLDPAVGSGAFPMAILQTLTLALRRLDPDNELWEKFQKERAIARSERAYDIDDGSLRKERLANISATFEKYRRSDFGRKLYLIQNGIYGVDIQPIACQIAKLRFFISLVLEQKHDLRIPNLGIQPLPNLETRLLAADSLLQLQKPAQMQLGERGVGDQLEEELKTNRERHFLAGDRSTKLEIQRNDERLRTQLADQLKRVGLSTDAAKCISAWDPYNQNTHADWFGPEYMFGVTGGFDVVIGNPPYIQLQKDGGSVGRLYRRARFQTFRSTGDIYQLFYERGCGLLKPRTGVLSYITSNSWLKAEYGKPLREWFERRHTPVQLIEMGKDVFENAIVDTAVLVVRNGKKVPTTCSAVDVEQASSTAFPPPKREWGTLKTSGDRPWMALSSVERSVIEKMEGAGVPLREWDISIYYGIKTGYNDAFIVDTPVRDRLIAEDRRSEEIIKPILRGRDIARYRANWANMWL